MTKKKNQHQLLKNRKPITEFVGGVRKEKFNGPGSYDIKDDPARVRTFSISIAPRFDHEKEMNEKKKKAEEEYENELRKKLGEKKIELLDADRDKKRNADAMFKSLDKPTRSVDFGLSQAPRFDWEQQQILEEMRRKRKSNVPTAEEAAAKIASTVTKKANGNAIDARLYTMRTLSTEPHELNVEKSYQLIESRTLTPILRLDVDREEAEKKKMEQIIAAKRKPLSEEEKARLASIENFGTIAGFVRASRNGDFSRGGDRKFEAPGTRMLNAPSASYEPNFDAIRPHVQVPVIQPVSNTAQITTNNNNNINNSASSLSEKNMKLAALQQKYAEDILKSPERAVQQLDKTSIHRRTPTVIMTTAPISANMPSVYNVGNVWNSRSMRALLCDTEGMKISCEAMMKSDEKTTPAKKTKKNHCVNSPNRAVTPSSHQKHPANNTTSLSATTSSSTHDLFYETGILSPFARHVSSSTPQPAKISVSAPRFEFFRNSEIASVATTGQTLHQHLKLRTTPSKFQSYDEEGRIKNKEENHDQDQEEAVHHQHQSVAANSAAIFSDGTSPSLVHHVCTASNLRKNNKSLLGENESGLRTHQEQGGDADEAVPTKWSYSVKADSFPRGAVSLASLLKKKKLGDLTVFTTIYEELGGSSKKRLEEVNRELYGDD